MYWCASILILIFIAAQPSIALFMVGVVYVLSGPVTTFRYLRSKKDPRSPNPGR